MSDDHPINVTYTSTPTSLRQLPYILSSINAQLPLRNFHWKSATKPSVRTVQRCDVRLRKLVDMQTKQQESKLPRDVEAGNLVEGSLVHICLVECEDNEAYKSSVRPYITSWIASLPPAHQSHAQNLIVLVSNATAGASAQASEASKGAGGMFTNLRSAATGSTAAGILSKLKSDFGAGTATTEKATLSSTNLAGTLAAPVTRVISLPLPAQPPAVQKTSVADPTLFLDLTQALKESIIGALDDIVREREDTVRKGEASMRVPGGSGGWNWTKFFGCKESLALTYERMSLFEDALLTYDELEASMAQVARDTSAFVGRTGTDKIAQADGPLFSFASSRREEHSSSPSSAYTIYDYHVYLFRRQVEILLNSFEMGVTTLGGKPNAIQIVERGMRWILSMGRWLRENSASNMTDVIEAFLYDSVLEVDAVCRTVEAKSYGTVKEVSEVEKRVFLAGRGELLKVAILQMDRIGLKTGIFPHAYPFLQSSQLLPQKDSILFDVPASPIVTETPKHQEAGPSASRELLTIVSDRERFFTLYGSHLDEARSIERGSGRVRVRLSLEERVAEVAYHRGSLESAKAAYVELCQDYLSDEARQAGPAGAAWHTIRMRALARAVECHDRLGAPIDKAFIVLGLEYLSLVPASSSTWTQDDGKTACLDATRRVIEAIDRFNQTEPEQGIDVFEHPIFELALRSHTAELLGTQDGSQIRVTVSNLAPSSLEVDRIQVCLLGRDKRSIWYTSDSEILTEGENEIVLESLMPLSGIVTLGTSKITLGRLSFEYGNKDETTTLASRLVRIPADREAFAASLDVPLEVSLESEPRLNLTLRSGRNRIRDVAINLLSDTEGVVFYYPGATSPGSQPLQTSAQGIIISGIDPAGELVISVPYATEARSDDVVIRLSMDYRTVDQPEVKRAYRTTQEINLALPLAVNVQDFFRPDCLISKFTVSAASHGTIKTRSAIVTTDQGALDIVPFATGQMERTVTADSPIPYVFKITQRTAHTSPEGRLLRLVLSYQLDSDRKPHMQGVQREVELTTVVGAEAETWRTLTIPVEVPPMQIISQSFLQFPDNDAGYRVGEPIDVRTRIETSTAWSFDPEEKPVTMMYDIIADKEAWLVAGPKRGSYQADSNRPFETRIILIPLRHGLLAYPSIVTQPMPYEIGTRAHRQGVLTFENYQQDAADAIEVIPDTAEGTGVVHVLRELGRVRDSWGSEKEVGVVG